MISFLCPTRNRLDLLRRSLDSICQTMSGKERVEVLLRVDDDDTSAYEDLATQDAFCRPEFVIRVFRGPRLGYGRLNEYHNFLAAQARGWLLVLWNDDSEIVTQDWDRQFAPYKGRKFFTLALQAIEGEEQVPDSQQFHCAFPAFPKTLFELLGHVSPNLWNDSWIQAISRRSGIRRKVDVVVHHWRIVTDQTAREERTDTLTGFAASEDEVDVDAAKIRAAMRAAAQDDLRTWEHVKADLLAITRQIAGDTQITSGKMEELVCAFEVHAEITALVLRERYKLPPRYRVKP